MQAEPRACIATTLVNADRVLDSFLRYHLAIGFSPIILFFDDPNDGCIAKAATYPNVIAIPHDDALRTRWRDTPSATRDDWIEKADSEVMVRQSLNTDVALQIAAELGVDWLLHIDIDELFFSPNCPPSTHFALAQEAGVECLTYLNIESVPETEVVGDYFREVTLFKNNPHSFLRNPFQSDEDWLNAEQRAVYDSVSGLTEKYFLFYNNGKSAVKIGPDIAADGVHGFTSSAKELAQNISTDPAILHYACCGFEHLWSKFETLGEFPDKWFGEVDIAKTIGRFYLDARDIILNGDRQSALDLYRSKVMISNSDDVRKMIDCGLLQRVAGPRQLLEQLEARGWPDSAQK